MTDKNPSLLPGFRMPQYPGPTAYPRVRQPGEVDKSTWSKRPDGSEKGTGYLGMLDRPDGAQSSEISIGVDLDGVETEIPTLVPTLTPEEVSYLLAMREDAGAIPDAIVDKATAHARERIAAGKSPFASDDESPNELDRAYARQQQPPPPLTYMPRLK